MVLKELGAWFCGVTLVYERNEIIPIGVIVIGLWIKVLNSNVY